MVGEPYLDAAGRATAKQMKNVCGGDVPMLGSIVASTAGALGDRSHVRLDRAGTASVTLNGAKYFKSLS